MPSICSPSPVGELDENVPVYFVADQHYLMLWYQYFPLLAIINFSSLPLINLSSLTLVKFSPLLMSFMVILFLLSLFLELEEKKGNCL